MLLNMVKIDRVKTGIGGLDDLIEGGFPNGSSILLTGGPGVGKTTFCSQYLWEGASNGESCLFLSTEEPPKEIKIESKRFGLNFDEYSDNIDIEYLNPDEEIRPRKIQKLIGDEEYDRIALDSISTICMQWDEEGVVRRNAKKIIEELRGFDTTVLVTAELAEDDSGKLSRSGFAEFIAEGVIKMDARAMGTGLERTLTLLKMRATELDGGIKDIEFAENGLQIK
jgi:KaiC/GvpD/RAD55 family RecA-like ATPase